MKKLSGIALLALLGTVLNVAVFPSVSTARVFRVFGPEDFIRSNKGPATEVRQFPVQYPGASDFTLHIFYAGGGTNLKGIVPSALVTVNGRQVVRPDEFNRNVRYIKKPITLSEGNSLSVELRGKPGSGIRVVITGKNDEPQSFDFSQIVQPDGSNLFGPDLSYHWTILNKPEGGNAWLSDPNSPSPGLRVESTGEYSLELRVHGDSWESEAILVKLTATGGAAAGLYNPFVPVPVKTRVVTGVGDQYGSYSISLGSTTYTAPAPATCGSPANSGFQVLVLDRVTLAKRDHQSFNVPCGSTTMLSFLNNITDSGSLVIVSSLNNSAPSDVCGGSSSCPLGAKLVEFGATNIFSSNYSKTLSYTLPDGTFVPFSYSLIGIKGLGRDQGYELNNWDHKALTLNSKIYSNIEGVFVMENLNRKWTFVYPEFVEIEARAGTSATSNTIKVGGASFGSPALRSGAAGGFEVVVLHRDTLGRLPWPWPASYTFSTNCGSGAGSVSESEQKRMYDILAGLLDSGDPVQRYVAVIASIGSPISYKSVYFTDLVKMIGHYYGGTIGVLNQLGPTSKYSVVGMTNLGSAAYGLGALDTVEASSTVENLNLRTVMHKDKQGWFKPVVTDKAPAGATPSQGRPDFSLLAVALQPYTPWPLPNPSHAVYGEELAAYQHISRNLGAGSVAGSDIRSVYTGGATTPDAWLTFCDRDALKYENIPTTERTFSAEVYNAMWQQLCGGSGEFNYLNQVNEFKADLDIVLLSMQASSNADLASVYQMVRSTVPVPTGSQIQYDAAIVLRGLLTAATSIVTDPLLKGTMGVLNGIMSIAMTFSKKPTGADYTAIDTAFSSLSTEMNSLWVNCQSGSHTALDMVKSDWGKLSYVAKKLTTALDAPPEAGGPGWYYQDTDPDLWVQGIRESLEAYYFQSLLPAVWKIDYKLDQTDANYQPSPKTFIYVGPHPGHVACKPYCGAPSDAYWVDAFSNGKSSWYVLENQIVEQSTTGCGDVHFDSSSTLRDVLFNEGPWGSGKKLHLDPCVFYERWLPSKAYTEPKDPDGNDACLMYGGTGCSYGAQCN